MESDAERWLERLHAVGKAQRRYLWVLLVAAVFFLALQGQLSGDAASKSLAIPFLQIEVSARTVWGFGPLVLGFLLNVLMGALRAYRSPLEALERDLGTEMANEALDAHPNALDFAVYTTHESPGWLKRLLILTYPTVLTLIWAEAVWLLELLAGRQSEVPLGRWLFWTAILVLAAATYQLLRYWGRNLGKAFSGAFWLSGDEDNAGDSD